MRKALFLLLALILPLAACGDDNPVAPGPVGSLSFAYTGDISGSFDVSGEAKYSQSYPQNGFAIAKGGGTAVAISGVRPTQRPKYDFFGIELDGALLPGTYPVCTPLIGPGCPFVYFLLGFNGSSADQAYRMVSGSVTISEISGGRWRGTFQGTAEAITATGQSIPGRMITITSGQFDVPERPDLDR